jgi:cullin-associated NEDD8-dissociated protein 1
VPEVVKALAKQAAAKSAKTRLGALGVLRALAQVAPAATLAPLAAEFADAAARSLVANERDGSNLRIEALLLLRQLLVRTPPTAFVAQVKTLTPHVLKAVADSYYRVSSEGLRTCAALVPTLAAVDAAQQPALAASVYTAVFEKMSLSDVDQDVKESAIQCAGELVSLLGDKLSADALASVLKLLYERMCNEITRLTAVRTLERIASAPTHVSLGAVLGDATAELGALLRQSARQLRQSALQCLCTIVERYGSEKACSSKLDGVLTELVPLVGDSDLHLAHLALKLGRTIVVTNPKSAQTASDKLLTPLVALLSSSLLQGAALESVRAFVGELSSDGKRAAKLVERLRLLVGVEAPLGVSAAAAAASTASTASTTAGGDNSAVTLSTCSASAQCIAVCAAAGGSALVEPLVTDVLKELKSKKVGDGRRVADLLVLRELGARVDLTAHNVQAALLASFDGVEDVKQSAALALGGSVVGNVGQLLPGVLKELASSDKQYLILSAVREVITRSSKTPEAIAALLPFVGTLLPLLVERCESKEEGTRNVVAECIGKLAMLAPAEIVPQLAKLLSSDKPATRATIVTALKCAIVERPHPIDASLAPLVPAILRCLSDSDLHCRKATLLAFQYAAHCKPSLVAALIPQFRDALYGETRIKPELVREVDLGPFKHKVDDGYELRKAAYECCFTLLGAGFARVMDVPKFIKHLVQALTDENDIRMLAHLIIARLAAVAGASLLEGLEQLVEPLRLTLLTKPKESAVKQEQDVVAELVRSAMRAVRAVAALDGIDSCIAFKNMHQSLLVEGELKDQFSAVMQEEASGPELGSSLTQSASFASF